MRRLILLVSCVVITQVGFGQRSIQTDSLDRILRTIKNPNDKVDLILGFLKEPKNQYLEDSVALAMANRALVISQQRNYTLGKINSMLKLGYYYYRSSEYKKAMDLAQKSKQMSEDLNLDDGLANSYNLIGQIYIVLGNYDNSSQYFFKSLKVFEKLNDKDGITQSLGNIGINFTCQQDYKKALEYYNKSLNLAIQINARSLIALRYHNIGAVYEHLAKYDIAIVFLKKALEINIKIGDKLGQGLNILNIGYDQMNKGKFDDALLSFQQSVNLFTGLNNRINLANCYINIGYCLYHADRINESIEYFKKALQLGQKNGYFIIISPAATMLNQIYSQKKDTITAYHYLKLEKLADDSLFAYKRLKLSSKLELQYINEKNEFERKLAQKNKDSITLILLISLISALVILGLAFSRNRLKSKFVLVEKERIELELVTKDRELTVNLISLIKKNEMLSDISRKLEQVEQNTKASDTKDLISNISKELRNSNEDKMFNEFSKRFQEVHAGFYENLLKAYPHLTQNELKLCAFLRLNMTTKEISELTGQQLQSLDQARYRLRKKLGLSNSEVNLVTFLSQV